jgi:hypothetical protein
MAKEKLKWEPLRAPVRERFITNPSGLSSQKSCPELWIEPSDLTTAAGSARTASAIEYAVTEISDDLALAVESPEVPYLIVGFDIEFTSPPPVISTDNAGHNLQIKVHSYQFFASTSDGRSWDGICLPDGDQRISFAEFMLFVIATGCRTHGFNQLPSKVFLVGHNNNLKLPLFSDFNQFARRLSIIQGTLATGPGSVDVNMQCLNDDSFDLNVNVRIRDVLLLVSQASKRVKDLAELVGVKEVKLTEDPAEYLAAIANMDRFRDQNWGLFKRFALNDAEICVKYLQRIIRINHEATGKFAVPMTLASIGITLLVTPHANFDNQTHAIPG